MRLRPRPELLLLLTCVGAYIGAAAQVRSGERSALDIGLTAVASPVLAVVDHAAMTWESFAAGRRDLGQTLGELGRLRSEVERLRHVNQLLAAEVSALRQGSHILAELPGLADQGILARVVARDVLITHTLRLDRGSDDGVALDSPVLSGSGVLGRVDRVEKSTCRVQLLTHPAAAAAARLISLETEGLLMGGESPILTGLPPYTEVEPDAAVVTTGSEGIYPPNLLLGTTKQARNEGLFTVAKIKLAVQPAQALVALILPPGQEARR